jgi:hypothetical protein
MKVLSLFLSMIGTIYSFTYHEDNNRLIGQDFFQGIKDIIGSDPLLPREQIDTKPLSGSFSNIHSVDNIHIKNVSYCLTDNACGHWEAYSQENISLNLLNCNKFCFIDKNNFVYQESLKYSIDNPPKYYLNCGWETCN